MQKKSYIQDLNIPKDDVECWDRYPKHHWVYDLSRLLDAQHVKWSPFKTDLFQHKMVNMDLLSISDISLEPAYIYIEELEGLNVITEVYISKGEIKLLRHFDKDSKEEMDTFIGNVELRINAFISMHFQKFSGIITVESLKGYIIAICLRPYSELTTDISNDIHRLTKKIYKKTDLTIERLSTFVSDLQSVEV